MLVKQEGLHANRGRGREEGNLKERKDEKSIKGHSLHFNSSAIERMSSSYWMLTLDYEGRYFLHKSLENDINIICFGISKNTLFNITYII